MTAPARPPGQRRHPHGVQCRVYFPGSTVCAGSVSVGGDGGGVDAQEPDPGFVGAIFAVSQCTVSRRWDLLRPLIGQVLAEFVPGPHRSWDTDAGRRHGLPDLGLEGDPWAVLRQGRLRRDQCPYRGHPRRAPDSRRRRAGARSPSRRTPPSPRQDWPSRWPRSTPSPIWATGIRCPCGTDSLGLHGVCDVVQFAADRPSRSSTGQVVTGQAGRLISRWPAKLCRCDGYFLSMIVRALSRPMAALSWACTRSSGSISTAPVGSSFAVNG